MFFAHKWGLNASTQRECLTLSNGYGAHLLCCAPQEPLPVPTHLRRAQAEEVLEQTRTIRGFAGVCEIEVAKFYCHIAPHDKFCKTHLPMCLQMKSKCLGFESYCYSEEECCGCSFSECPLEEEGCQLIGKLCAGADHDRFNAYEEIQKLESKPRRAGRKGIRINGSKKRKRSKIAGVSGPGVARGAAALLGASS